MFFLVSSRLLLAVAILCAVHGAPISDVPKAGDPCIVEYPIICDGGVLIDEEVSIADKYGPNVCFYNETYKVTSYSYVYKQRICLPYFCPPPVCYPTTSCNTSTNIVIARIACCKGYAVSPSTYGHDFDIKLEFESSRGRSANQAGCPIRLKKDVVECLDAQNLSDFKSILNTLPSLTRALSDTTNMYTIFATINNSSTALLASDDTTRLNALSRQIINGTAVAGRQLFHGAFYATLLPSDNIQVTRASNAVFIDGLQLLSSDPCLAENGVVHVISGYAPAAFAGSIAGFLRTSPEFTTFNSLVQAAGITRYLESPSPKTVFAPTNDAFPAGALTCLTARRNREALLYVVLLHISQPAEYTSTLSLRAAIRTVAQVRFRVESSNGTVYLTRNSVPIVKPNIQATNGVVHGIPRAIFGSLDYGRTCPTAPLTVAPLPGPAAMSAASSMESAVLGLENQFPAGAQELGVPLL